MRRARATVTALAAASALLVAAPAFAATFVNDAALQGTNGLDVFCGLAGDDFFAGMDGDDFLFGDDCASQLRAAASSGPAGDDTLFGMEGDDWLDGGADDDVIDGGGGQDRIVGNGGADRLAGGSGRDQIDSADDDEGVVICGRGRDEVRADRSDHLRGCEKVRRVRSR